MSKKLYVEFKPYDLVICKMDFAQIWYTMFWIGLVQDPMVTYSILCRNLEKKKMLLEGVYLWQFWFYKH